MKVFKKGDIFHVTDYRNGTSYKAEATDDFALDELRALEILPAILVDGCPLRDGSRLNPGDRIPGRKNYIAVDSIAAKAREKREASSRKDREQIKSLEARVAELEKQIQELRTAYEHR